MVGEKQISSLEYEPVTSLRKKNHFRLFGIVLALIAYGMTSFFIGSKVQTNNRMQSNRLPDTQNATLSAPTTTPRPLELLMKREYIPEYLIPSYNAITSRSTRATTFMLLPCLQLGPLNNQSWPLPLDTLLPIIHDNQAKTLLNDIKTHQFTYTARIYDEQNGQKHLVKEAEFEQVGDAQVYAMCNDNLMYHALIEIRIPGDQLESKLFSLIPQVRASGMLDKILFYIATIDQNNTIDYLDVNSETNPSLYTLIPPSQIKQYGYENNRRMEYLSASAIAGKVNNNLLLVTQTVCYECRDNPAERSYFSLSLNPPSAQEIAFCTPSEAIKQTCYDPKGSFTVINNSTEFAP
jgi:hypothetical protein